MNNKSYPQYIPSQTICIPASEPVDVSEYIPIIDHPHFQRLKECKQLGVNYLVFPGATHTRFEHAIGTLGLTRHLCRIHRVNQYQTHHLCAFALLHDLGHGPFSHQIEPILNGCHKQQGLKILQDMKEELELCNVNYHYLANLFTGKEPTAQYITHRTLGTDKLDYLRRDSLHIGFSGMPPIDHIQLYTLMYDNILCVEEKFLEDIKRIQKFYSYLHQHGYLNKTALSLQRIFQRAVYEAVKSETTDTINKIWQMTDMQLIFYLQQAKNPLVTKMLNHLNGRNFHRTVLVIKPESYSFAERLADKQIKIIEWNKHKLKKFSTLCNSNNFLAKLEDTLAQSINLQQGDLLFAAMPYFDKLLPRDVRIFTNNQRNYWLFKKDKEHHQSLISDYLRTFSIRITVPPKHRTTALKNIPTLIQKLEQHL